MNKNKGMQLGAMFAAMLLLSMAFVPAVSAQVIVSNNDVYANAKDMRAITSLSESDIKKISKDVKILKNTTEEKIISIKKDDGSIEYAISWFDKTNQRTNFAFVSQSELKSLKKLTSEQFKDDSLIASTISAARIDFWHGSYLDTYGDLVTGGFRIHLTQTDAQEVVLLGGGGGALLFALLDGPLPFGDAIGIAFGIVIGTVYWAEQNSDGSLDIRIPYASAATFVLAGHAFVQIGSGWYYI